MIHPANCRQKLDVDNCGGYVGQGGIIGFSFSECIFKKRLQGGLIKLMIDAVIIKWESFSPEKYKSPIF